MIPRIPISDFPANLDRDPDIENAYKWIRKFIPDKEWERRKKEIESHLGGVFKDTEPFSTPINEGTLLVIQKDQITWYLYLVHTFLYEPHKYEYYQGARVLPIFKRFGMDLDLLAKIDGIEKKFRDLLWKRRSEADSFFFEILTAVLWTRNGWKVKVIEEGKSGKTPDFSVSKGDQHWEVECKRQKKTSDYTYRETRKRQILISHISKMLLSHNVLLNITFHVELSSLPDTYLHDILHELIPKTKRPGKLISNETIDVDLDFVDILAIRDHLSRFFVKHASPQHFELIANMPVDQSSFTSGIFAEFYYVGDDNANNLFISDVRNAFGVHCYCDSELAFNAKARDVRNQIFDALGQFNRQTDSIIHIGMETFDGPEVERARSEKIIRTMGEIDTNLNTLGWIYFHYFQSYSRASVEWYFDETVSMATSFVHPIPPLAYTFLVIPEDEVPIKDASHWERDLP